MSPSGTHCGSQDPKVTCCLVHYGIEESPINTREKKINTHNTKMLITAWEWERFPAWHGREVDSEVIHKHTLTHTHTHTDNNESITFHHLHLQFWWKPGRPLIMSQMPVLCQGMTLALGVYCGPVVGTASFSRKGLCGVSVPTASKEGTPGLLFDFFSFGWRRRMWKEFQGATSK